MIAIGDRAANRWHLQFAERWVVQFNFYVNDRAMGPHVRAHVPYLPFSARVCLNQHHWLANRMREEGIDFQQCSNAFMRCAKRAPARTGRRAKPSTSSRPKWLACFTPFFTATEREHAGCHHRLFSQTEFCDNLVFHRRAALDTRRAAPRHLSQRLHQAIRARSPHPAHRGGDQQRHRLRRQKAVDNCRLRSTLQSTTI